MRVLDPCIDICGFDTAYIHAVSNAQKLYIRSPSNRDNFLPKNDNFPQKSGGGVWCANQCIERPLFTCTGIRREFLRLASFSGAIESCPKVQRAFWSTASFDFGIRSRCLSNVVSAFLNPFWSCSILSKKILLSFKKAESNCSFTSPASFCSSISFSLREAYLCQ